MSKDVGLKKAHPSMDFDYEANYKDQHIAVWELPSGGWASSVAGHKLKKSVTGGPLASAEDAYEVAKAWIDEQEKRKEESVTADKLMGLLESWRVDGTGTRYKTYRDSGDGEHPELEGYVTKKGSRWIWELFAQGKRVKSGTVDTEQEARKACDKAAAET